MKKILKQFTAFVVIISYTLTTYFVFGYMFQNANFFGQTWNLTIAFWFLSNILITFSSNSNLSRKFITMYIGFIAFTVTNFIMFLIFESNLFLFYSIISFIFIGFTYFIQGKFFTIIYQLAIGFSILTILLSLGFFFNGPELNVIPLSYDPILFATYLLFPLSILNVAFNFKFSSKVVELNPQQKQNYQMFMQVYLSFMTLGIYGIFWEFKILNKLSELFNEDSSENKKKLILINLVPFYNVIWGYEIGNKIHQLKVNYGLKDQNNSFLYALLNLFILGPFTLMLLSDDIFKIQQIAGTQNKNELIKEKTDNSTPIDDELTQLNSLLQKKLITKKEYTLKRKKILNKI